MLQRAGRKVDTSERETSESTQGKSFADLQKILENIVVEKRLVSQQLGRFSIEPDISHAEGIHIKFEASELERVLSNIIQNAIEALEDGGKVRVSLRVYTKEVAIIIIDDGKGIPQEILTRLGQGEVSFGKDQSTSGAGLGVYHAKKTIESFGGRLIIQSRLGEGTIVTITLPVIDGAA